jgi:hypothetical protein
MQFSKRGTIPLWKDDWGSARGSRAGSGGAPERFVEQFSFVKRVFGAPPKTATGPVALPNFT